MALPDEQLKALLVQAQVITEPDFDAVVAEAHQGGETTVSAILKKEIVTDSQLGQLIASSLQAPFVELSKLEIPEDVLLIIPEEVAKRHKTVAFARDEQGIKLATSDYGQTTLAQMVGKKTGQQVFLHYATDLDIENILLNYKKDLQKELEKLLQEGNEHALANFNTDPPVEKMVDAIIYSAYQEKASDIHIEPQEQEFNVRFRIDGMLHDVLLLPKYLHDRVVTRIKVLSKLRTDEHLAAQDGKMRVVYDEEPLDLRVSILPIADGEKVVMRLLASRARALTLADLGMSENDLAKVTRAFSKSFGMVLCTGPTGSGKSTSIYSILKVLNTRDRNITTIEDPVEYKIKGANQIQVNAKTNLTFANGLRAILRQDPNIILVGEIRDNETAGIAVNAALTGHLVVSTLHTNDAAGSLPRLSDMKVEPFLVASTVNVIIAQRLVRKICEHCRVSLTTTQDELLKHLTIDTITKHYIPVGDKKEIRIYKGEGCKHCHFTGYQGRVGVYEVLEMTAEIKELVVNKASSADIMAKATEQGMTTMLDDGLEKITKGLTTIEEVLRVTKTES